MSATKQTMKVLTASEGANLQYNPLQGGNAIIIEEDVVSFAKYKSN